MSTVHLQNVGLIRDQSPNPAYTIVVSPTIQRTIRSSIGKWHLGHGCSAARSLRPGTNRDYVLSLGMPSIQERRTGGAQATTICRLPQSGAAPIAMDMLITPVRLFSRRSMITTF